MEPHRFVKVGRNILMAQRSTLTLHHYIIGDEDIRLETVYTYNE